MGIHIACDEVGFYTGIVVDSVSPDYYALTQGENARLDYYLVGHNLSDIPSGCVGLATDDPSRPLKAINYHWSGWWMENIVVTDDEHCRVYGTQHDYDAGNYYLGAILDSNNNVIWRCDQ